MKHFLLFFLLLSTTAFAQTDNQYNLIPFPARFSGQNGQFNLTNTTRIVIAPATDASVRGVAQTFAGQIKAANGVSLAVAPSSSALAKGANIFLTLNKKLNLGDEGYKLTVTLARCWPRPQPPRAFFMPLKPCGNCCPPTSVHCRCLPVPLPTNPALVTGA
nr:glycoside hydrolase family 20 zincin-like fold domain-containing protein [Spirosoma aerolatum]